MERILRCTRAAVVALAAAALLGACAGRAPSRTLYQWTDGDGNARYTAYPDRVPPPRRHTRRPVVPGTSALENAGPIPARDEAVATEPPRVDAEAPVSAGSPLDERIGLLEARVAADQETLKTLIADPERAARLRESPELREISERLPALQRELDALRAQRDDGAIPDGS